MYYLKYDNSYIASTVLPKYNLEKYTIITQEEYKKAMTEEQAITESKEAQENVSN